MHDAKAYTIKTTIGVLACVPTALVWGTAAGFALVWIHGLHVGTIRAGFNTTQLELTCVMFGAGLISVSGMSASIFVCVWRRSPYWQAALFAVGFLAFWLLAGG